MEGERRGAAITCHTGAFHVAWWTGDLPFGGTIAGTEVRKGVRGRRKGRRQARLTDGAKSQREGKGRDTCGAVGAGWLTCGPAAQQEKGERVVGVCGAC